MDAHKLEGASFCTTMGLLTATGAETVYDTTVAIQYCIDGRGYTKGTVANGTTPTTDANTGAAFAALEADQACVFLWLLDAAGTVAVAQGPVVDIDGETDEFKDQRPQFPDYPGTMVPFAYQIVQTAGNSSAWTFGSSNWNATGVTDVIVDVMVLPSRPPADARS